ncbi:MAG TPA: pilus assembly protein, partial [Candidatus Moranbacteria bacterium]|nr:pilus assembly protein [Candidatus Moranbacteria bacterium]
MKKIKSLKGFTLIELLIVIAIIGILASIVLVSL